MHDPEAAAWSDSPPPSASISGRAAFVAAIAGRITQVPTGTGSTVFGLVGPWGSGKTTLLRDIENKLSWDVVWFTPWSAADVGAITEEFVAALQEAFPQVPSLKSKLATYARLAAPAVKAVPVFGEAAADLVDGLLAPGARPAWHSQFQAIADDIAAQDKQVLLIVDDVDRLDGTELRALLRVIRLLGRFANVHYLLAYDQTTIDHLLANIGMAGRSSDFMEKIVQFPFEVPPAPRIERRRWARELIGTVVEPKLQLLESLRTPSEDLVGILAEGIETPRSNDRLREQLLSLLPLAVEAELDGLDFVTVTWLRLAHHDLWEHMRTHSALYCAWREASSATDQTRLREAFETRVVRGSVEAAWAALQFLFPGTGSTSPSNERPGRMREPRYFDRYFLLGLADDDVSDAKTATALQQIISEQDGLPEASLLREMVLGLDAERAALALRVAQQARQSESPEITLVAWLQAQRNALVSEGRLADFRQSVLERWLGRELAFVLAAKAMTPEQAVESFGYEFIIASAYGVRHPGGHGDKLLHEAYPGVIEAWQVDSTGENLKEILERPELFAVVSLAQWLDVKTMNGAMAGFVSNAEDLIAIGKAFVTYQTWTGIGIHFDAVFNAREFLFAVGSAFTVDLRSQLPAPDDSLEYKISDREDRELDDNQLRDFTIRQLSDLAVGEDGVTDGPTAPATAATPRAGSPASTNI